MTEPIHLPSEPKPMKILLSTIGSRGDVQPLVAIAFELRSRGHDVHFCVPPDFQDWLKRLGFTATPVGPELQALTRAGAALPRPSAPPSPDIRKRMAEAALAVQFPAITQAAQGCDLIVGATALQLAAPSVAEKLGIPYRFVAYCPTVIPSPRHAPPPVAGWSADPGMNHREQWAKDAVRWNDTFREALNAQRRSMGLTDVEDVRSHVLTAAPWLATDPVLGPWPGGDGDVFQSGAWFSPDRREAPAKLQAFLDSGDPPIYFGFGSMSVPAERGATLLQAARAAGRRAIIARGWADLTAEDGPDVLSVGEINQQWLFRRVAAVAHHGGAGTTTVAAWAGAPQVIIPKMYDQRYWAGRVTALGIGAAHDAEPTAESLQGALASALDSGVQARAAEVSEKIRTDGVRVAADRLVAAN